MSRAFGINRLIRYAMAHPIGERQRLRTIARIVRWQIRSRFASDGIEHHWIGGSRLIVSQGMTGATGNLYFGLHEFADMGFILHCLRPGELFIDVGANIGSFSVLAAKVVGSDVIAFEPDAATAGHLARNIDANGVADKVTIMRTALGDQIGELWFTSGQDTINHVVDQPGDGVIKVPVETLDNVLAGRSPVVIKIDVEGHEPAVLAGAQRTLANPSLLAIEVETVTDGIGEMMRHHGFVQRYYDPFSRALTQSPAHQANNSLYVRDELALANRLRAAPAVDVYGIAL